MYKLPTSNMIQIFSPIYRTRTSHLSYSDSPDPLFLFILVVISFLTRPIRFYMLQVNRRQEGDRMRSSQTTRKQQVKMTKRLYFQIHFAGPEKYPYLYFQVNRGESCAGPDKYPHRRNETAGLSRQTEASVYKAYGFFETNRDQCSQQIIFKKLKYRQKVV